MPAKKSFQYFITVLIIAFTIMTPNVAGYSGGSGTPEAPYQIDGVDGLLELAADTGNYDKCFILTADIDLQGQVFTTAIIAMDTSSTSGFQGTVFRGTFDGNGHKITYFTINGGSNRYLGLFGWIDSGGEVKNLGLENCAVSGGAPYVGGLVGYNYGSIRNCYASGTVSGSTGGVGGLVGRNYGIISNCYSTGAVSGSSWGVGGLVGKNYGGISNCYSIGTTSGVGDVGGLVGSNCRSINNCYSTGVVSGDSRIGGLVGYNCGSITNCYSTGSVNGGLLIGGLVAFNNYGSISNCYSTGAVDGNDYVGGLVGALLGGRIFGSFWDTQTSGQMYSAGGTGKTTAEMQDINTFLAAGWDFLGETANGTCNYWQMPAGGGYPVLSTFNGYIPPEPAGSGTEDDPYVITDANDLGTMWYRPTAHYRLANAIDLVEIQWSVAVVPAFGGALDGNGFCIKNLSINGAYHLGLFGWISSGSSVKNLGLENCDVSGVSEIGGLVGRNSGIISNCYSTGSISGSLSVGGLVGQNYGGSISNCYSAGVVGSTGSSVGGLVGWNYDGSIINCYSTGSVSGDDLGIGGLVGRNYDTIINCYSTGEVSGYRAVGGLVGDNNGSISNCYSTGAVSGDSEIGGLVGGNHDRGSISDCYSTGDVSGVSEIGGLVGVNRNDFHYQGGISNCYSTGAVSGDSDVGGLVGHNARGSISNCYSTGVVSGTSYVGGLVGRRNRGSISDCYFLITSGPHNGYGTPLTDAQMKQQSSFVGWDFVEVWDIVENETYPFLRPFLKPIPVAVDIKPGSCPNPLNVKSSGVLPVAVLGSADVNVLDIVPTSIAFSFGEVSVGAIRNAYEDVGRPVSDSNDCNCITEGPDGFLDLTLKFKTQRIVDAIGDVNDGDVLTLELTGVLYDPPPYETPIEGADCILVCGRHKPINPADINKDGVVNAADFAIFVQNWLQSSVVED